MDMNQRIYNKIILISFVLFIGICHGSKVQAENSAPETAYQEFLEGRRVLHIDEEMLEILKKFYGTEEFECGAFSMKEILEKINVGYYQYQEENNRLAGVEYAYLDCGNDGSRELAVRFDARSYSDMFQLTFIIIYENGTLYLRHAFESWSRNSVLINQYGYIWESGSDGAASGGRNESYVDSSGRAKIIFDNRIDWGDIDEPEICQQVYGTEECFFCNVRFQIQDKEYKCLLDKDEEDPNDEDFALFKKLYEEKYGKIYTKAEIEKLLDNRRKELGITEEMTKETEPDWESLETAAFKDQVREIDLKETRKKAQAENESVVKKGWKTCSKDSSKMILLEDQRYLNYNGEQAIEYALGDYCNEKNISDMEWSLIQTVFYGDMLHAVTVQNKDGRIICLMLCSDAAALGLPEYTEYLLVADCHLDKVGVTIDYSSLDWNSYDTQVKQTYSVKKPDKLCNFYYVNAFNQYLTEQDADPSVEWEFDSNAVCRMDYRKIIVRFISGEQEIVMVVDADYDNPRYSVIIQKGLVELSNGEEETDPITAYQEFLDGKRKLGGFHDDEPWLYGYGTGKEEYYIWEMMEDMLEGKEYSWGKTSYADDGLLLTKIDYAFLDYGNDGKPDLAVRFGGCGWGSVNSDEDIYLITCENGKLVCKDRLTAGSKSSIDLYYYGYNIWTGDAGVFDIIYDYTCPDASGAPLLKIKSEEFCFSHLMALDKNAYETVFDKSPEMSVTKWLIDEETYYTYQIEDDEEHKEICEQFIDLCEQDGLPFCSDTEMEKLINEQAESLGIKKEWLEKKEVEWIPCLNTDYRDYVKEIAELAEDHIASEDEAYAYLEQQVPELKLMSEYIETHSDGKARYCVSLAGERSLIHGIGLSDYYFGYYYVFYVGESWEDHIANWHWFYVKDDLSEILRDDIAEGVLCTLEEWRSSEQYLNNELYNNIINFVN